MRSTDIMTGINKNVLTLSVTSLLTDISSEMLYPIIPIFLTSVLGAPMAVLGLIEGFAEAAASLLKVFSGYISDKYSSRKPLVVGGYSCSAIGKLLFVLAYSWPLIFIARLVDRIGKGIRTSPRDAMIADSSDLQFRGKAFGFHRAMDTAGACIGPLVALLLLHIFSNNLRAVLLVAAVPAIAGVIILMVWLKETGGAVGRTKKAFNITMPKLSPAYWKFLAVSAIFFAGNSSDAFLIMRAKDIGLTTSAVILTYVLYNISYSALSLPAGIISDKLSRRSVLIAGYIIFALVYLGFGAYLNRATIWPLFFVYGFYMAMTDGVSKAFVSDLADKNARGSAIGIYYCVTGIAVLFASCIAGIIWTYIGPAACFIYGSAMAAISIIAFVILVR